MIARSREEGRKLPILVIRAENKETMQAIMALRSICYTIPRWDDMRKQPLTQCHNCLQMGHSQTGGCLNKRRCKACQAEGADHVCQIKLCPELDKDGREQNVYREYFCFLCEQKGHPATWSKCPAKLKILRENEVRRTEKNERKATKYMDAPLPTSVAWKRPAETQKKTPTLATEAAMQQKEEAQFDVESEVQRLMGTSSRKLQELAEKFAIKYKTLTDDNHKRYELARYFLEVHQWRK